MWGSAEPQQEGAILAVGLRSWHDPAETCCHHAQLRVWVDCVWVTACFSLPGQALWIEQYTVVLENGAGSRGRSPAPGKPVQQDAWLGPSTTAAVLRCACTPGSHLVLAGVLWSLRSMEMGEPVMGPQISSPAPQCPSSWRSAAVSHGPSAVPGDIWCGGL